MNAARELTIAKREGSGGFCKLFARPGRRYHSALIVSEWSDRSCTTSPHNSRATRRRHIRSRGKHGQLRRGSDRLERWPGERCVSAPLSTSAYGHFEKVGVPQGPAARTYIHGLARVCLRDFLPAAAARGVAPRYENASVSPARAWRVNDFLTKVFYHSFGGSRHDQHVTGECEIHSWPLRHAFIDRRSTYTRYPALGNSPKGRGRRRRPRRTANARRGLQPLRPYRQRIHELASVARSLRRQRAQNKTLRPLSAARGLRTPETPLPHG
jgi:hypothetical protein